MNILFISFGSTFTEGFNYQDNLLALEFVNKGHEVSIIADCYMFKNNLVIQTIETDSLIYNGKIRLIRLKYVRFINEFISKKIRHVKKLDSKLKEIKPDIIYVHNLSTIELITITHYKKNNPNVVIYCDGHMDFNNSARNIISQVFLHRLFYRYIISKTIMFIDMVFFVSYETRIFLKKIYKINDDKLDYLPLGGIISSKKHHAVIRQNIRKNLGIQENSIVFLHTGKFNFMKKTNLLIKNFIKYSKPNMILILIGSFEEKIYKRINKLINTSPRVKYLGWFSGDKLLEYLHVSDYYLQPGSQSATLQNAICAYNIPIVQPHMNYKLLLGKNAIYITKYFSLKQCFEYIGNNHDDLVKQIDLVNKNNLLFYHNQVSKIINHYHNRKKVN
jgi:hypothetical protein